MEGTDQIFATRQINSSLSTHGTVDHGKQSRRNLIKGNSTKKTGGGETSEVARHSSSNREKTA